MIVATTQFDIRKINNFNEFWDRVSSLAESAARNNAEALLFPEYFALSAQLCGREKDFRQSVLESELTEKKFRDFLQVISNKNKITIVAGTFAAESSNKLFNRCNIVRPNETPLTQSKVHMTRFEKEEWIISSGVKDLTCFNIGGAKCAVAICYDVEFPEYTKMAAREKVDILFVPSCTEDEHGYWRVRHCSEARAIENQCYVILSSVVGGNIAFPEIGIHYGRGAIHSPCDIGFPASGLIAEGETNVEGLIYGNLDLSLLANVRANGTVLNLRDQE